ncbi:MAG: flagellar biosynthetic protein FliO [Clostridium tyrobutyricum]|uniref:flagellar biosynthetic protein FliO n=2 Tax=Clostridium tyrobutyricum TaxID=1519 RepID=UPI00057C6022|nr:flagellar biosynthetic protein FliO [Clostridium tyrobutyricum]MCH4237315.1 flagellar biosynthetic protein FliO [Clostridium tyrobutyricum]MCH4257707.1 flagellar biosynthetic protein FliO [Clostridium tyrobutyricum]MCI1238023.1 flagellar biosynthetic protein FliO [Clostridium tyrobutyricum]MCI1651736.1 flagellar biosynthetic protein FliO [Clostridium tyrobutyricum]MCI1936533.1 flagellar biosynthetic protein FliO [Clostridium tyrobutyricum]
MDSQFLWMFFKTIMALAFVIFLIYISLKYGGGKFQNVQKNKFVKILQRSQISKENSLLLVKIGERAYVISSTTGRIEILYELDKDEISTLQNVNELPQYKNLKDFYERSGIEKVVKNTLNNEWIKKLRYKKEDNKHEK